MENTGERWRKPVNQAVRDFASSAAGLDDETLRTFFNTMLREIGEALSVDCCALVDVPEPQSTIASAYAWCQTLEAGRDCAFQSESFARLVQQLALSREPLWVTSSPSDDDDDAMADVKRALRDARL